MSLKPVNLKLAKTSTTIIATWEPSSLVNLGGWKILWRVKGTVPWSGPMLLPATTDTATITGLLASTEYEVQVRALAGEGAATAAATTEGAPGATIYWGAQTHATRIGQCTEAEALRELELLAAAGANVVRVPVEWAEIEAVQGVRGGGALTRLDYIVNQAHALGMKVIGTLATTPTWASTGGKWFCAPSNPAVSVKPFAKWLIEHYGSSKLAAVEGWNEPNWPRPSCTNFQQPSGVPFASLSALATAYTAFIQAVYAGAREADPEAHVKVLALAMSYADSESIAFYNDCIAAGMKGHYDGLAFHPYADGATPENTSVTHSFKGGIEALRAAQATHGDTAPLWPTEFGWSEEVSEALQAEYVEHAFTKVLAGMSFIAGASLYRMRAPGHKTPAEEGKEERFGLLHENFTARPSYARFQAAMPARP